MPILFLTIFWSTIYGKFNLCPILQYNPLYLSNTDICQIFVIGNWKILKCQLQSRLENVCLKKRKKHIYIYKGYNLKPLFCFYTILLAFFIFLCTLSWFVVVLNRQTSHNHYVSKAKIWKWILVLRTYGVLTLYIYYNTHLIVLGIDHGPISIRRSSKKEL